MQCLLAFELDVLGTHPLDESLKSCGIRCVVQTFCSSWRSCELWFTFWLYGAVLGMGFMVRVCIALSYLFQCGYFLIHLIGRDNSATFWISFWGHCSMCSYTFSVSVVRKKFRSRLCHHLGPSFSQHTLLNVYIHYLFHSFRRVMIVTNLQKRKLSVIEMCRFDPKKCDFKYLITMKT